MSDDTYNGWKNYPTWAVNLWLSSDEGLYNLTRECVADAASDAEPTQYWTLEQARRFGVADALKDQVEALALEEYGRASFVADLLGWAIAHVDWDEIANAWLEDYAETADA